MVSTQVSLQTARSNLRDQLYLGEVSEVVLASLSAVLGSGDADAGAVSDCDGWGRRGVGEAVRSGDCLGPSIFDASTGSFEF